MNTVVVKPEFRTNPLSNVPGGSTIGIIWDDSDNYMLVYNNIKNPDRYIQAIIEKNPHRQIYTIFVDNELVWQYT